MTRAGTSYSYALDDLTTLGAAPGNLGPSKQGYEYTGTGWVKGTSTTAGKNVVIVVREFTASGALVGQDEAPVTLTSTGYVRASVTRTAAATGNTLDVYFYRPSGTLVSGDAFFVDAVSLTSTAPASTAATTLGALAIGTNEHQGLLGEAGSRFRYMIVQDSAHASVATIKANNPSTKVLVYKNLSSTVTDGCSFAPYESTGVSRCVAESREEWFLHDKATSERLSFCDYSFLEAMNIANPAYRQEWLDSVLASVARTGYDGVFVDDVNLYPGHCMDGRIAELSDAAYATATQEFIAKVGPAIQAAGYDVMPNVALEQYVASQRSAARDIALHVSVFNREHFVRYDPFGVFTGVDWTDAVTLMESIAAVGTPYAAIVYGTTSESAVQRYSRATFLLGWDGKDGSALTYDPPGSGDLFLPDWTTDVGTPIGPRYAVGIGWRRPFSGGTVVLNPSATAARSFSLGASYRRPDGGCTTSVTLQPATAMVLKQTC